MWDNHGRLPPKRGSDTRIDKFISGREEKESQIVKKGLPRAGGNLGQWEIELT